MMYWVYDLPNWQFGLYTVLAFLAFGGIGLWITEWYFGYRTKPRHEANEVVSYYFTAIVGFYGITLGLVSVGTWQTFADADNKVPIEEYGKIEQALADGADVAIGSRGLADSRFEKRQSFYRQLGGQGFGLWLRSITGLRIRDTQCGFKFFPAPVARDLFDRQKIDGYMFDAEILYIAHKLGYSIKEVPVTWRDDGDSRLDLFSGNVRNFRDVLRVRKMHGHLNVRDRAVKSVIEVANR